MAGHPAPPGAILVATLLDMVRGTRYPRLSHGRLPARAGGLLGWLAVAAVLLLPAATLGQSPQGTDAEPPTFSRAIPGKAIGDAAVTDADITGASQQAAADECAPQDTIGHRLFSRLRGPFWQDGGGGQPIPRESWLRRPLSLTWFLGVVEGSPLITDWVNEDAGIIGGPRIGWDFDQCWGTEMRFAVGSVALSDSQRAKDAQWSADTAVGAGGPDDPYRRRYDGQRNASLLLWDVDVLAYPWGDNPWRPYVMVGMGTCAIGFEDRLGQHRSAILFGMPIALGLKYHCTNGLALRFEVADNVAFGGSGINTLHQVSLTAGGEFRFGGGYRAYWPWNPNRSYW